MINEKLAELGLTLPKPSKPLAAYIPGHIIGNMLYTSGHLARKDGELIHKGKIGAEVSEEAGMEAAKWCIVDLLATVKDMLGSLDRIEQIVKITVFVNCVEGYGNQPKIANGASEMLVQIFGEKGKHARSAVGVSGLPLDSPVEIEMIALIKD